MCENLTMQFPSRLMSWTITLFRITSKQMWFLSLCKACYPSLTVHVHQITMASCLIPVFCAFNLCKVDLLQIMTRIWLPCCGDCLKNLVRLSCLCLMNWFRRIKAGDVSPFSTWVESRTFDMLRACMQGPHPNVLISCKFTMAADFVSSRARLSNRCQAHGPTRSLIASNKSVWWSE